MTAELPSAPAELSKLRGGFGATARANGLPSPPARPRVEPLPTFSVPADPQPEAPEGSENGVSTPIPETAAAPELPAKLLTPFLEDPRAAVIGAEPQRKASTRRQFATYIGDDAYRTLLYMSYKDGCPTWKWVDTMVRAIAQQRGVELRAYAEKEFGR